MKYSYLVRISWSINIIVLLLGEICGLEWDKGQSKFSSLLRTWSRIQGTHCHPDNYNYNNYQAMGKARPLTLLQLLQWCFCWLSYFHRKHWCGVQKWQSRKCTNRKEETEALLSILLPWLVKLFKFVVKNTDCSFPPFWSSFLSLFSSKIIFLNRLLSQVLKFTLQ